MKTENNKSELVILKEYRGVISNFLARNKVEFDIHSLENDMIKVIIKLQPFTSQKAFNLGIKLQRHISEYTKINIPNVE